MRVSTRERAARPKPWTWGLLAAMWLAVSPVQGQALPALPAQPLSLSRALLLLDQRNETLAAEQQVVARGQAELDEAQSRLWPELSFKGGVTRLGRDVEIDMDPVREAIRRLDPAFPERYMPRDVLLQRREFGTTALTMKWPLYAGGRIEAGIAAANAELAANTAQLEGTQGSLRLTLVQRYFADVLARQALQVRQAAVGDLQRHRDHAERLQRAGQIPHAEVLRAEVALSDARREADAARYDVELTAAALAALLASEQPLQAIDRLPPMPQLPALAPLIADAQVANPSMRSAREQSVRARAGVKAARGESLPTVALVGQHELYTHQLDLYNPEWAVGMVVEWPLLDGGGHRSKLRAAQARADEVDYRVAAGRRDIELLVRQRYQQLAEAHQQYAAYQTTRALATESLRAQRRAFEEGLATSLDVADAEQAMRRVELGLLAAHYDGIVAWAGLQEATGRSHEIGRILGGKE